MLSPFGCSVLNISLLTGLAKLAFFAALLFTFYSAVIPPQHALQLVPWDKAEHFIAFYGLTGLAAAAFPRRKLIVIVTMLSGFGALIEYVQGLPLVHRDRDFWDWVADTIAIIAALAPMLLVWWRGIAKAAAPAPGVATPGVATPDVATPDQKNIDM
ncbi:MAG: VanZ family protein [Gammaproteobacteria bacterium]|nr:VanZ family protein [Gammaproteobacteria bacterium]